MEPNNFKLCVNCKHFDFVSGVDSADQEDCTNEALAFTYPEMLVRGQYRKDAKDLRRNADLCGPEAAWFELKPPPQPRRTFWEWVTARRS